MSLIGSYDYAGLCKAFLTQSKTSGKTTAGRMSFSGTTLYSYNSKLAKLDLSRKALFIDECISTSSNTSKRHTRMLKTTASSSDFTSFHVSLEHAPEDNLLSFWESIIRYVDKYNRAKVTKDYYARLILNVWDQALSYAELMGIDKRSKAYRRRTEIFKLLFTHKLLKT